MTIADTHEIEVMIHRRTDTHIWVSTTGDPGDAVQLRRASVRLENKTHSGIAIMTISEGLAIERGLV